MEFRTLTNRYADLQTSRVARLAIGGALITGWVGIILAINAMLSGNDTGAGICLIGAALAFGFIINRNAS